MAYAPRVDRQTRSGTTLYIYSTIVVPLSQELFLFFFIYKGDFMSTKKPQLKTYIEEIEYLKFKQIAENENRSISNLLQTLVFNKITEYEKEHGTINIKNINVIENKGTINM